LDGAIRDQVGRDPGTDTEPIRFDDELRNPRGAMHGAAVYATLWLTAHARIAAGSGTSDATRPIDGRARFLRPVEATAVTLVSTIAHRSRRLVDVDAAIVVDGVEHATGRFTFALTPED